MKIISKEEIEELRNKYQKGMRVKLIKMNDTQAPQVGTLGTVERVDDIGTIFVRWENGSGLGLVYGEDQCQIVD